MVHICLLSWHEAFGSEDKMLNKKTKKALIVNLFPVCVEAHRSSVTEGHQSMIVLVRNVSSLTILFIKSEKIKHEFFAHYLTKKYFFDDDGP